MNIAYSPAKPYFTLLFGDVFAFDDTLTIVCVSALKICFTDLILEYEHHGQFFRILDILLT